MSKKRRAKIPPFRVLNSENIFRKFVSKIMRSCDKNFAQLQEMNEFDDYNGSLFGANPVFLQEEKLELASYQFCMQIYGGDFPEEFQDIFYLDDAIGYLFLSKEEKANDVGVFFVQCT